MVAESWSLTAKLCASCKTASASVFCRADSAFLCMGCDSNIHAANKLASRHARVWMCEVCEQAPATVTCKADAAALCANCDHDIHSANPLARRHQRVPVIPFYDSAIATKSHGGGEAAAAAAAAAGGGDDKLYLNDLNNEYEAHGTAAAEEEEAEAASWLLTNPNTNAKGLDLESSAEYLFSDMDRYLDMDIISGDKKPHSLQNHHHSDDHQHYNSTDGVVPVQNKNDHHHHFPPGPVVVDGFPTYEMDYNGSKPFMYNFSSQSISQSVSSSSLEVGVVPDHTATADVSTTFPRNEILLNPVSGADREARVLRYREKRKNRKFEKTIRYASRKAYAETRPRIKGRFAKRTEVEVEVDSLVAADASYVVVPSF